MADNGRMHDKTCVVTGANAGIGKETALNLAGEGARVVMVCRDRERGEAAQREIGERVHGAETDLMLADLSSLAAVRALARDIDAAYPRVDVLVNNAGVLTRTRKTTVDGNELTLTVNYLAPFLLTTLLCDKLKASAPARVVNVSSGAHTRGRLDLGDLQRERRFTGWGAYCQSKLALNLFTFELARRLEGSGVTVNCLHPGTVGTELFRRYPAPLAVLIKLFTKSPQIGARTTLFLAASPAVAGVSGGYFIDYEPARPSRESRDRQEAERLWRVSETLTA